MKKIERMPKQNRAKFLKSNRKEEDLDDSTFNMWKSELQKELPSFWESMSKR